MGPRRITKEFGWFSVAAVSSALSDLFVFTILVTSHFNVFHSQGISRVIGGITSFLINKHMSFEKKPGRTIIEIRRFLLLYAVSYSLSFFYLWFYHRYLALPLFYAKPLSDGTAFVFNFIVMRFYVYNKIPGLISGFRNLFVRERESW